MRPTDTSPAADDAQIELWRRMPGTEKFRVIGALSESVAALHRAGLRRRNPGATERELFLLMAQDRLGVELAGRIYGSRNGA